MKAHVRINVGNDGFTFATSIALNNPETISSLLHFSYPKNFGEAISSITIKFYKDANTGDDSILFFGKEIDVWHSDTIGDVNSIIALPSNTYRLFRGYVTSKRVYGNTITITASDLFIKAQRTVGTDSTDINVKSATNIVGSGGLLDKLCIAAGLTSSFGVGTPTPTQVVSFVSLDSIIFERIQYLLNLIGWYGLYDPTTANTIKFQPKTAGDPTLTYSDTDGNIIGIPNWNIDGSEVCNTIKLIGGTDEKTVTETHTITGGHIYSLQAGHIFPQAVVLSAQIGTAPKTSWTDDEFLVTHEAIIFTKQTEPTTVGNNLYINFRYHTAAGNAANTNSISVSSYGSIEKVVQKRDTLSTTDLTSFAANIISDAFWGQPLEEVTLIANDIVTAPILGAKVNVTDPTNNKAITYTADGTIIYSIEYQWPNFGTRIFISSRPLKNPMQQTSIQDEVQKQHLEIDRIDIPTIMRMDGTTPLESTSGFWNVGGAQLLNLALENSIVAPIGLTTGGLYFDTSAGAGKGVGKINVGTAAVPSWTVLGSGGVTAHSALTQLDYASAGHTGFASSASLADYLPLAGSIGSITTRDHHLLTGLSDDDHPQYALLSADNIFTGDHQIIRGGGGSAANYPTILLRNTTWSATDFTCLYVDDSGYLVHGQDGIVNKLAGGASCVGHLYPNATTTYTLGTSSLYWNYGYIKNIYMNDGVFDLRTDNVHKIGYASGTNSLDIQSYDEMQFLLTQNGGVVPMSIMTDGIRVWESIFFRKNQASDTVYIIDDATANMEFHVGTGKVFEFIVG